VKTSYSLGARLILGFLLVAAAFSLTTAIFLEYTANHQFREYMEKVRQKKHQEIIRYFEQVYAKEKALKSTSGTEIAEQAMRDGNVVTLLDKEGALLWEMDREMIALHYQMMGHPSGSYEEKEYPLLVEGSVAGIIRIGNFTGIILSPEDMAFRNSLRRGILLASLFGILMAFGLSILLSRKLVAPIKKMKRFADHLRRGDLRARLTEKSGTREMDSLGEGLNYLAKSLENQEELRKELTKDISHELRTPLNTLNALIEAYIDGVMVPTKEHLEECREEILRMADLTRDLERLSDLEGGILRLSPEELNLGNLVCGIARSFEPLCAQKEIALDLSLEGDLFIQADRDKLRQVILNLLSNAVQYTPSGGQIGIRGTRDKTSICLAISDSGVGIGEKDLPRIFERFYRVDKSRSRHSGGAGIGLAIVDRIVQASGWKIYVTSQPGEGSVFTIEFPHPLHALQ
jgi:signal transduction histidine kinase